MLALFLLIFVVREQMASGRDFCGPPPKRNNTVPVTGSFELEAHVRIECKEGFVRKAGTSNLIRCRKENGETDWRTSLPLECIYNPSFPSPPTQATKATALNESTQTTGQDIADIWVISC
ncbi:hypothetical protein DNTS_018768 [Danionella cerebrum]|uniref:Sushi domain-containing protein n=1 Tax=Danionella cerebrum TaxID=2873325 RepID=A0A553PYI6_9TELE|nr:hypothetical protein DNTS_018768 [Danionella translucida]